MRRYSKAEAANPALAAAMAPPKRKIKRAPAPNGSALRGGGMAGLPFVPSQLNLSRLVREPYCVKFESSHEPCTSIMYLLKVPNDAQKALTLS